MGATNRALISSEANSLPQNSRSRSSVIRAMSASKRVSNSMNRRGRSVSAPMSTDCWVARSSGTVRNELRP